MAPSEKTINEAIHKTFTTIWFHGNRDELSVNNVRSKVEKLLNLGDGFLKTGAWKDKSKALIRSDADKYGEAEEAGQPLPEPKPSPSPAKASMPAKKEKKPEPAKKNKRASNGDKEVPRKRQKKAATPPSDHEESDTLTPAETTAEESELSEFSDAPNPKKVKKPAAKPVSIQKSQKKKKKAGPEDEDVVEEPKKKLHVEVLKKDTKKATSDDDSELSDLKDDSEAEPTAAADGVDSDSDMSVVIDEGPKPKKAKRNGSKVESSKPKTAPKAKVPAELNPDEQELKMLQSHLVKCGIRKIWAFELKEYADDIKGKIRHLKSMLKEVGMEGRFSEAKARDIKESRELKAELEAVQEGEQAWGMGKGKRSKGSNKKKAAESEDDDDEEEDEEEDQPPPRIPRAKLDLAFLGDESESD